MYYVYSLKCSDGFYIGCTNNLKDRFERHKKGYVYAITNKYLAFNFESYLKSGSGRAFINKHFKYL
jgi:predicted GIY-YIG superfamily endonuclease